MRYIYNELCREAHGGGAQSELHANTIIHHSKQQHVTTHRHSNGLHLRSQSTAIHKTLPDSFSQHTSAYVTTPAKGDGLNPVRLVLPGPTQGASLEGSEIRTNTALSWPMYVRTPLKTPQHLIVAPFRNMYLPAATQLPKAPSSDPSCVGPFTPTGMHGASETTTRYTHEKARSKRTAGNMLSKCGSTFRIGTRRTLSHLSHVSLSAPTHTTKTPNVSDADEGTPPPKPYHSHPPCPLKSMSIPVAVVCSGKCP